MRPRMDRLSARGRPAAASRQGELTTPFSVPRFLTTCQKKGLQPNGTGKTDSSEPKGLLIAPRLDTAGRAASTRNSVQELHTIANIVALPGPM